MKADDPRAHNVHITAEMDTCTPLGGFAIQHTGSGWDNASCLQHLKLIGKIMNMRRTFILYILFYITTFYMHNNVTPH